MICLALFLLMLISSYGNITEMSLAEDERECLRAFKNSVSDPQGYLRDWNFLNSSHADGALISVCGWKGVDCSANKVMALSLRGAGLHSEAPFSLAFAQCFTLLQLDLSHNSFQGPIPADLCTQMPYLTHLDMSHNQLVGSIPHTLGDCSDLAALRLDNNLLSGEIPWQLGALPRLRELDLSYNNLSGFIPSSFASTNPSFPAFAFAQNPHLCGPPLHSNVCVKLADSPTHLSHAAKHLLEVGIPMLALLIVVIVLGAWYCRVKGMLHQRSTAIDRGSLQSSVQHIISKGHPIKLTWEELHIATNGFSQANIVGSGGSSTVYKGKLKDGRKIAVKLIMRDQLSLVNTPKELFLTELKVLGKLRHRNLVRILGHSFNNTDGNMAIILDYIPMGSLDTLLHRSRVLCEDQLPWRSPSHLARWKTRINILLGIAEGLAYLHHGYDHKVCVIHGDLKPSNVLLDANMEAHIADFGHARIVGAINSTAGISRGQVLPTPCWSVGYTAPECLQQGALSRKADVFSFGMIVLEVITGKRPSDNGLKEGESLVEWVSKALADGRLEHVVAPALLSLAPETTWFSEDVKTMLRMGCQCASTTCATRPNMQKVVAFLCQLRDKAVLVELLMNKIPCRAKNLSQPSTNYHSIAM